MSELGEPLTGENSYIDISESLPNAVEQQELRLRSNEAILVIKRTFDYRDRPVVYEEISLPTGRFPTFDFTSMAKSYRISTLADQCGIHLLGGKEKVDVGTADREVATRLGIVPMLTPNSRERSISLGRSPPDLRLPVAISWASASRTWR